MGTFIYFRVVLFRLPCNVKPERVEEEEEEEEEEDGHLDKFFPQVALLG